jgi:HSP20 family molecular chaperone IbpA
MSNVLTNTLRGAMAPWYLGDLEGFIETANKMHKSHAAQTYPPHSVLRLGDDTLVLQMALVGINPEHLTLESTGTKFTISYETTPEGIAENVDTQYKGISTRKFRKSFKLEEPWEVTNATLNNGLLEVTVSQVKEPVKTIEIKVK